MNPSGAVEAVLQLSCVDSRALQGFETSTPADSEKDAPTGYGGFAPWWDFQLETSNDGFSTLNPDGQGTGGREKEKRDHALKRMKLCNGGSGGWTSGNVPRQS